MEGYDPTVTADDIVKYINMARANPSEWIEVLKERHASFEGKVFKTSDGTKYQSAEGPEAVDEALACFENAKAKSELERVPGLDKAAQELCEFNGETGGTSHIGKDDSRMGERIDRYGKWIDKIGECVAVQPTCGKDFVLQWVIDDGVKSRGDRKTVLNAEFTKIGVFSCKHKIYGTTAVCVFAKDFIPKDAEGNIPEHEEAAPKQNDQLLETMPEELKGL